MAGTRGVASLLPLALLLLCVAADDFRGLRPGRGLSQTPDQQLPAASSARRCADSGAGAWPVAPTRHIGSTRYRWPWPPCSIATAVPEGRKGERGGMKLIGSDSERRHTSVEDIAILGAPSSASREKWRRGREGGGGGI